MARGPHPQGADVHIALDLYNYIAKEAIQPVREYIANTGLPAPTLKADQSLAAGTYRILGP